MRNRKSRRDWVMRKMAAMRAAKERKRLERGPIDHEPLFRRTTCLSLGFRDDLSGHIEWVELISARQAHRLAGILIKHYQPGFPQT